MKKRKCVAVLLAWILLVCFTPTGMNSVKAAEKTKHPTPTNVTIDNQLIAHFDNVVPGAAYDFEYLKDEAPFSNGTSGTEEHASTMQSPILNLSVNASGIYKFRVRTHADADDPLYESSDFSDWVQVDYTVPTESTKTTVAYWDAYNPGVVRFATVVGAMDYEIVLNAPDSPGICRGALRLDALPTEAGEMASYDYNWFIDMMKETYPKMSVSVRALSNNLHLWTNGPDGPESEYFDFSQTGNTLRQELDALGETTAANEMTALKNATTITSLQHAMENDTDFLNAVREIETKHISENSVTVQAPAVVGEAATTIDAAQVSAIGVACNATTSAQLQIGMSNASISVFSGYTNPIKFDLSLTADSTAKHTLDIPIQITMPVPSGINVDKLIILHYHEDGYVEQVNYQKHTNGKISLTTRDFSPFVFAQTEGDTCSKVAPVSQTEQNSGNQETNTGGGNPPSVPIQPTPNQQITVDEPEKEPVVENYVIKKGDSLSKIARQKQVTIAELLSWNPQIKNPNKIWVGQILVIKSREASTISDEHQSFDTVKRGDSLFKIAKRNNVSLSLLNLLNPELVKQKFIYVGQKVRIQ